MFLFTPAPSLFLDRNVNRYGIGFRAAVKACGTANAAFAGIDGIVISAGVKLLANLNAVLGAGYDTA
jgi:hypothetical protein